MDVLCRAGDSVSLIRIHHQFELFLVSDQSMDQLNRVLRMHIVILRSVNEQQTALIAGGGATAPDRAALYNGALVRYLDFNDSAPSVALLLRPADPAKEATRPRLHRGLCWRTIDRRLVLRGVLISGRRLAVVVRLLYVGLVRVVWHESNVALDRTTPKAPSGALGTCRALLPDQPVHVQGRP